MQEKKPGLAEMTTEQLLKNEKTVKSLVIVQVTAVVIMAIVGIILASKKGFSVFSILPVVFIATTIPMIAYLSSIRKEIRSRA
ncbi:MAG: hypothetical protein DI535_24730 [Citrobacter freundii]|nr:MAG: hypothetical protein DI535_24730 [Citrobacter freundii]